MEILEKYSMKKHSNMKIGGEAKKFIKIENKEELKDLLKTLKNYFIIGNGTNTLLNDEFLDITFISLKKLNKITDLGNGRINVEAGLDFGKLIKYMAENNLSGLEELAGIPGTVGGLVFMNGGAYGKEIFDHIESVEILNENKEIIVIPKSELKIDYRRTEIKENNWIIISANFKFDEGYKKELVKEIQEKREKNQPLEMPNLGSTFKNPKGYFAARLIIEAGAQGLKIGGAQMSMKHPNFIVNDGTATFEDVLNLIAEVKKKVKETSGVELEREIIILK
ncbi:UDP-N-acetylmuramate dehydrogenase [Fusobacterium sp.]|uniref:UDP-N-acetylmuramate dehydrogenase n=1 Tax=Fusobacterium sp. TaxID=68766 RepID=UPI002616CCDE|nr:UDP-N-acetylmuramate dehydrogenase [Fusobacterium sp.]